MISAGLMNTLQVTVLVLVAAGATVVVRTRTRVRQVLALSVYGMLLAILFLVFQAPDVTLSELTVGAVALPIILLLAIAKVRGSGSSDARGSASGSSPWPPPGSSPATCGRSPACPASAATPARTARRSSGWPSQQTNATGVVSAINFEYRGFDTVGEEFILFAAAAGMSVVLRKLREERERPAGRRGRIRRTVPPTSSAVRVAALLLVGPTALLGWWLASHAQTSPSGGFQGGVILASAFILIYLAGEFLASAGSARTRCSTRSRRSAPAGSSPSASPRSRMGLPYLDNYLPLGTIPGAVSSSGTIALISFFVGIEVAAAFVLIVGELLEQTLLVRRSA